MQAIIDGITSLFAYGITRLKKEIQELEKKLEAGYSMLNKALQSLSSEIQSL